MPYVTNDHLHSDISGTRLLLKQLARLRYLKGTRFLESTHHPFEREELSFLLL